jgi:HlyD family secretion protein
MKKRWWVVVGLVVVAGGGLLVSRLAVGRAGPAAVETEVETAVVERGTLLVTVDGSGSLAPQQEIVVPFEASGRIVEVLVRTGSAAGSGDVLVRLDDTDARRALANVELTVKQSEVGLASAQLTLDKLLEWESDGSSVELAEANLAAAEMAYQKARTNSFLAGDQITSSEVNLTGAQRNFEDAQEAYDSAYDPGRDWELGDRRRSAQLEAEREGAADGLTAARDNLSVAQAAYNLAVAGVSDSGVASAWSQVVSAQISLENETEPPDEDDIESARLQVEQAQVSLEQAKLSLVSALSDLADTELSAPASGTVAEMDLQLGQMVNSGQTGVVLADLETLQVEIGLDESDIVQVSVGQPAVVAMDAFDDVGLSGVVDHIEPTAQSQSGVVLYVVTVVLDPTAIPVRAGMTADVEVVTTSAQDALIIALKAVQSVNGNSFVDRRSSDGSFAQTQIELGVMAGTQIEVLSGLEEGDVVLVASASATPDNVPSGPFGMMSGGRP